MTNLLLSAARRRQSALKQNAQRQMLAVRRKLSAKNQILAAKKLSALRQMLAAKRKQSVQRQSNRLITGIKKRTA